MFSRVFRDPHPELGFGLYSADRDPLTHIAPYLAGARGADSDDCDRIRAQHAQALLEFAVVNELRLQLFPEKLLHGAKGFQRETVFARRLMNHQCLWRSALLIGRSGRFEKALHALLRHPNVFRGSP